MVTNARPPSQLSHEQWEQVDAIVHRFEEAWQQDGTPPEIDGYRPQDGPEGFRLEVLKDLVHADRYWRQANGLPPLDYLKRYPELPDVLTDPTVLGPRHRRGQELPEHIGGYPVEKILGEGAFGIVYLAYDRQLARHYAIKVPRPEWVSRPEDAQAYLKEARIVAGLNHPNIVPVHHVGSTDAHPFFIVSKFIEGGTLAERIKKQRFTMLQAAELVAIVAETLHYAHRQGLVHRDIKPGNILLDFSKGKAELPVPYVADFGLALESDDIGSGASFAGTPVYMSPEQARGEGHRVDGRSDIFSLGVVFYELLTGKRPFSAKNRDDLLYQITSVEARPPRQLADIDKELERICLKSLAKRAADRYLTAQDMADDLRHFLGRTTLEKPSTVPLPPAPADPRSIKIVPKGLRSFDNHDAGFFLELVPGPRDREGLPDSILFWKTRIEEMDADNTFAVGLIYGPSGCGKSSLVKAGLLPKLNEDVIAIYIESSAQETESRLLNGLRKRCRALPADLVLKEALALIRRGKGIPSGKKVLVILDQFEQWLHANKEQENSELVEALRQCDGGRVQSIVMVRDDFWLAVSRFLKELEVRLLDGQNSALVDLFDMDHAKKVLAEFGRAFSKLPEDPKDTSKVQKQFLEQAVTGLAREGKVVCVRLALFAEMMKGKTWTPASLKAEGGAAGVGVTFLKGTFSKTTAPPEHHYHQQAALGVLKALLPDSGADIKGHMRSYHELFEASGYARRPKEGGAKEFDDLLHILDSEVRLITPTDPEGLARDEGQAASDEEKKNASFLNPRPSLIAPRYYQLTHDYLVHSLRDWLTAEQRKPGGAELNFSSESEQRHGVRAQKSGISRRFFNGSKSASGRGGRDGRGPSGR